MKRRLILGLILASAVCLGAASDAVCLTCNTWCYMLGNQQMCNTYCF
jgi:hypothetical protein